MPVAQATPGRAGMLPRLQNFVTLARNFVYDFRRYRASCFIDGPRERQNMEAHIRLLSHMLEYGLSLSDPRSGFGLDKVRVLAAEMSRYIKTHGADTAIDNGLGVLSAYVAYNAAQGADVAEVQSLLNDLLTLDATSTPAMAGSEQVSASAIQAAAAFDFTAFMHARHSVRQYDRTRPVEVEKIERAIAAAIQSPSSCNRQTTMVLAFTNRDSISRVLSHHQGNRGFGDQLGGIFVVTVDLRNWNTVGERNQGWVDGGMFAMTLALGLHAEGLGACMLNWSATMDEDRAMRALLGLSESHVIITLIGFGHMVENLALLQKIRSCGKERWWYSARFLMGDFKWRHFQGEVILWAVRWYCRYGVSYRDLEQMMGERGVAVDHSTIYRWVQKYAPEIEKRLRWHWRRPQSTSWRVDETYVKVRGKWTYLYRAVDKFGNTIDFYLSPTRNAKAAKRFLGKALNGLKDWEKPTVINTDKAPTYGIAISELKADGKCPRELEHRQVKYLNNVVEADHGKLKQLIKPVRGFKTLKTAYATIKGFEVMRALRKGQAAIFNLTGDIRGEARIVERAFGIGPSALTEVVAMLQQNLDAKPV